ncbi:unnamed protein product [Periconia digitata]|uniref:Uncharacterized protein n=1 Tax=Periconia digitata TaxID=1303443 RepID=A0A9W4ULS0_9PLEO|nr:unnamed protein product [Periconia digitata]
MTERSIKFYDGTYKVNSAHGFWDSEGQYHEWGDVDDPETWYPPTPPPAMPLDEIENGVALNGARNSDVPDDVDIGAPRPSLDQTTSNAQRNLPFRQKDSENASPTSPNTEAPLSTHYPESSLMSSGLNPAPWSRLHIREDIFQAFSGKGKSSGETFNGTSTGEAKPQQQLFAGLPDRAHLAARLEGICIGTRLGSESKDVGLKDCYDWCGVRHDSIVEMVDSAANVMRGPPLAGSSDHIKLLIPADQELDTKHNIADEMNASTKDSRIMTTSKECGNVDPKAHNMVKPNKGKALGDTKESRHPKKQVLHKDNEEPDGNDSDASSLSDAPSDMSDWELDEKIKNPLFQSSAQTNTDPIGDASEQTAKDVAKKAKKTMVQPVRKTPARKTRASSYDASGVQFSDSGSEGDDHSDWKEDEKAKKHKKNTRKSATPSVRKMGQAKSKATNDGHVAEQASDDSDWKADKKANKSRRMANKGGAPGSVRKTTRAARQATVTSSSVGGVGGGGKRTTRNSWGG